jgi:hypothetical protein
MAVQDRRLPASMYGGGSGVAKNRCDSLALT